MVDRFSKVESDHVDDHFKANKNGLAKTTTHHPAQGNGVHTQCRDARGGRVPREEDDLRGSEPGHGYNATPYVSLPLGVPHSPQRWATCDPRSKITAWLPNEGRASIY